MLGFLVALALTVPTPAPTPRALLQDVHLVQDGGVPVTNATDGGTLLNVYIAGQASGAGGLTNTELRTTPVPVGFDGGPVSIVGSLPAGTALIGHVAVDNFPAPDGGALGSVTVPNLDVALSTRTKPADQQHTIIDSSAPIAVTGPATDTQLRATPLPVSGSVTVASTTISSGTVSASALGADGGTTFDVTGSQVGVTGSVFLRVAPPPNPFIPRCNPVRRTGCLP